MNVFSSFGMFLGRIFLGLYFLWSGVSKIFTLHAQLEGFVATGLPAPKLLLVVFIAIQIVGGLSLFFGYRVRLGAFLLIISRVFGVLFFHNFWDYSGQEMEAQKGYFLINLALMGGLFYVLSCGPGLFALGRKKEKIVEPEPVEVLTDVEE